MAKRFRVQVFGKPGCDKCRLLNQRLDRLLQDEAWREFDKVYYNLESEEGIMAFCEAECINPQRIPALLVTCHNEETGEYDPVPNPEPGAVSRRGGKSRLYQHLGLQTDYAGRGVMPPKTLAAVLAEAAAA